MPDPALDATGAIAHSDVNGGLQGHGGALNAAIANNAGPFEDDEEVPTLGIADAAIATVNESWQEMGKAPNAAIRGNADEGASADDEEMLALALGAIANGNFLQGLEEEADAQVQDGDVEASDESDDDEEGVTELLHPELYRLLYQICLILGSLVIAVSSAVAIYRVETSLNWWSEQAACGRVLLPGEVFPCLKWRAHGFLAINLIVAIVGILGAMLRNLRLLLLFIFAEASMIPAPFVVTICCLLPHSLSYYIFPNSFQYFLFVAWEGNSRSLWIPMLCAGPVIVACFVCAAQLYDAVEIGLQARALIAAVQERWDRRHVHRRRG